MIAPARGWPSWLIACTGMETDWARSGGADQTIAIVSSVSVTPIRRSKGAQWAIVGTSDGNRPPPRFPLFDYPRVSAIRNVSLQYGFHVTPDAVLTLLRKPALADLDIQGTESAGISRHIVGDARALQERRSDSILASSLALDGVSRTCRGQFPEAPGPREDGGPV